ncbi:MAG: prepilin-type N-terminal cleavage/methylation domain-containing protein [Candidatus Omnitrophica bacterium]|nr:prepilin-type N-terminal cleavage/methylation domain-containing protein [Candidatus Omnitrophota bacterium]
MRAFTLIELLISMFIMVVIIAGIYIALSAAQVTWDSGSGMLDLQQSLRPAIEGMTRELRRSSPSLVTVSGLDAEIIEFSVPGSSNSISYYILDSQLIREHPSDTTRVLANDVNNLSFCCVGGSDCFDCANASIVQVEAGVAKSVKGRSLRQFDLINEVSLRNE